MKAFFSYGGEPDSAYVNKDGSFCSFAADTGWQKLIRPALSVQITKGAEVSALCLFLTKRVENKLFMFEKDESLRKVIFNLSIKIFWMASFNKNMRSTFIA